MPTSNLNGNPHIESIEPMCALPGGEIRIIGRGLRPQELRRPEVRFGDVDGSVVISSEQFIVARVPEGASSGDVVVATNGTSQQPLRSASGCARRRESASGCQPSRRRKRATSTQPSPDRVDRKFRSRFIALTPATTCNPVCHRDDESDGHGRSDMTAASTSHRVTTVRSIACRKTAP